MMAGPRSFLLLPLLLLALVVAVHCESPPMLGGLFEANENEEDVQQALNFAVTEFNRGTNDKYGSRVFQVLRVRKQVVSGLKYYFDVEIRRTTCSKSVADLSSCPYHVDPLLKKHSICQFVVYTIPWLNQTRLTKNECRDDQAYP
ncbi:cystatin-like [Dromiciops gliroides]|uniref:cystatin-like n=1 Tax=Dromiciops gliroides TaxID=33562 RepID=UPI001CC76BBB|nr:cystatin-like [Dromiciops gliroides]